MERRILTGYGKKPDLRLSSCPVSNALRVASVCLAFATLLSGIASGQDAKPPASSHPFEDASAAKPAAKPLDTSSEPYVYETVRGFLRYENDGTGALERKVRVRVQSSLGVEKLGQLVLSYNSANERLDVVSVRVIKPDGKIIVTGPDSVQDLSAPVAIQAPMYSDARQKHVTVAGLSAGDILEYDSLNTLEKSLTPGQFWQSWKFVNDAPCLDEQVELNVPANRELKIESPADVTPTNRIDGNRKIYTWKTTTDRAAETPLPPLMDPKRRFDPEALLKGVQLSPSRNILLSSFENWQQVGSWYSNLERDRRVPTPELKAQAEEITKDSKTDLDKVLALYEYVTRNIRYVSLSFGMGRYQPHAAAEVLTNRYGDCKDKATLLDALLEAEGIHSSTALINSTYAIDRDVPTPVQFDHAITFVSVGGKDIWLDSTAQVAPFEYLLPQLRGKEALVVFPQQPAELKETPKKLQLAKYYGLEVTGSIKDKKLDLQLAFETRGDFEVLFRAGLVAMPASQFSQLVSAGARQSDPKSDIAITDFKAGDPFDTSKPFRMELHMTMTAPDKEATKPASSHPTLSASDVEALLSKTLPDAPSPKEALSLPGPEQFVFKIKVDLPEKKSVATFQPVHVKKDFAEFTGDGSMDANTFSAHLDLNILVSQIPADQIEQYTEFRTQVIDGLQHLIHVVKPDATASSAARSTAPAGSATTSPANDKEETRQLYLSGVKAYKARNYRRAADLFESFTARDPSNSSAFNELGRAYLELGQYELAIASFRKSTELNSNQFYAYNNWGLALWHQQKYDEAVVQFQKQLQINPDDKYVHPNLARLYGETKEYEKEIAELEIVANAKPDDAVVVVSLARAYLETSQAEKAEKAFARALDMSPGPATQNDIAYVLGEMNVQMDRAETLVKSAIATTSAQTLALDLDNLSKPDAGRMCNLAAYWDTLGWIKFHEGDLPQAEKFIGAAWGLCEFTAIGDHLGQIYEKEGRKADAILQYELTLGKLISPPETRPRLAALLPAGTDLDAKISNAKTKRAADAGIKFTNSGNVDGNGEAWLVIKPGPTVDAVKFIIGSEELRATAAEIRAVKFPNTFPDSTEIKLLRRACVTCSNHSHECLVGLMPADTVLSVTE
jgi:tetratricopeptide (TPR) repeat protein